MSTVIGWHGIQGCSTLSQRKSGLFRAVSKGFIGYQLSFRENWRWNSSESALISSSAIWVFSAVESWIRAVQRFSGNEQRWIRTETFLNQSWTALICSGTSTRDEFCWRCLLKWFFFQKIFSYLSSNFLKFKKFLNSLKKNFYI